MTHGFHEQDGTLYCDALPLSDIAREVGTPAYVYSTSEIVSQFTALKDALARHVPADRQPLLCYACKANTNIAILKILNELGSGLEIVSEGELAKGLAAGFTGERIISTSYGKLPGEIRACLAANIKQLNIESMQELETVNRIAGEMGVRANVLFRLNPNVSGGGHHKISTGRKRDKFGQGPEKIFECYQMATDMAHIDPIGLSVHIGSQVTQVEAFEPAYKKLAEMTHALRERGYTVSSIDIGGGFPVQYQDSDPLLDLDQFARWVNDIIVPLGTDIQLEPGRYLIANAGVLLSEVVYVKETQERNFLVLDAAMNDLIRPTLYEAYHGIEPAKNRTRTAIQYDVVGPVCESGDTFAEERMIPEMRTGEIAAIRSAGAYGSVMASNYNTRPLAPEIIIDGDRFAVIRERQTIQDIIEKESIPDWL